MKFLRIKIGLKYICFWALLLQLVNLSIDPARHQNFINGELTFEEDLSVNKIESIYELVVEHLFKKDVPETQNAADHAAAKTFIIFYQSPIPFTQLVLVEQPIVHNHSYVANFPEQTQVLESPPPKLSV